MTNQEIADTIQTLGSEFSGISPEEKEQKIKEVNGILIMNEAELNIRPGERQGSSSGGNN